MMRGPLRWLVLATLALVACKKQPEALCDEVCECESCDEATYEECVEDLRDTETAAARKSCVSEFSNVISCRRRELVCRGGVAEIDGCEIDEGDLVDCLGSSPTTGSGGAGGSSGTGLVGTAGAGNTGGGG